MKKDEIEKLIRRGNVDQSYYNTFLSIALARLANQTIEVEIPEEKPLNAISRFRFWIIKKYNRLYNWTVNLK